ncbi:MAG: protein kinase [Pirellulaceae bacterium]|nr:protein kinase [Pirellulaceae bacterium]
MPDQFDPYYKWLGIPPEEQPPNHYRLLGVRVLEDDLEVIEGAANRQMSHIRDYLEGSQAETAQRILNEIGRAWGSLIHPKLKAAYDANLRKKLAAAAAPPKTPAQPTWPEGKAPQTAADFAQCLAIVGLLSAEEVAAFIEALPPNARPADAKGLATELVKAGKLTRYQAGSLLQGKLKFLLFGEYVILDKIGQGGMGHVLKAEHRRMKRTVALKVMSGASMKDVEAVRRFQREVQAAARLIHPNIVTAFDASEAEGVHFLVMEFVDGKDLFSVLKEKKQIPVEQVVDFTLQTARGLAFAHESGIIHRDIKPANLLLDKRGTVKILDMGLARLDAGDGELTQSGQVMGTIDYMAPEQALETKNADARSDIYSLGCTLYRLLTNELIYDGDTLISKLIAHRDAPIPDLRKKRPDVPAELPGIFQRMVAKLPENRYQSMPEVIAALEALRGGASAIANASAIGGMSGIGRGSSIGIGSSSIHDRGSDPAANPNLSHFFAGLQGHSSKVSGPSPAAAQPRASGSGANLANNLAAAGGGAPAMLLDETSDSLPADDLLPRPSYAAPPLASHNAPAPAAAATPPPKPKKKAPQGGRLILIGSSVIGLVALFGIVAIIAFMAGSSPPKRTGKKKTTTPATVQPSTPGQPATPLRPVTPPQPAQPDMALDFDGQASYVEVPGWTYDGTHSLTVEAWVFCRQTGESAILSNAENSGLALRFLPEGNLLGFHVHSGGAVVRVRSDAALPLLTWVHVAGVIEGQQVRLYVGGVKQGEVQQLSAPIDVSSQSLLIGANPDAANQPTRFFDGMIDEVRISKIVRYTSDFRPRRRFPPDAAAEVLLHLDDGQGSVSKDSTLHKREAQIHGATWLKANLEP